MAIANPYWPPAGWLLCADSSRDIIKLGNNARLSGQVYINIYLYIDINIYIYIFIYIYTYITIYKHIYKYLYIYYLTVFTRRFYFNLSRRYVSIYVSLSLLPRKAESAKMGPPSPIGPLIAHIDRFGLFINLTRITLALDLPMAPPLPSKIYSISYGVSLVFDFPRCALLSSRLTLCYQILP